MPSKAYNLSFKKVLNWGQQGIHDRQRQGRYRLGRELYTVSATLDLSVFVQVSQAFSIPSIKIVQPQFDSLACVMLCYVVNMSIRLTVFLADCQGSCKQFPGRARVESLLQSHRVQSALAVFLAGNSFPRCPTYKLFPCPIDWLLFTCESREPSSLHA